MLSTCFRISGFSNQQVMMKRFMLCGICLFYCILCVHYVRALIVNRNISPRVYSYKVKQAFLPSSHKDDESAQVGSHVRRGIINTSLLTSGLIIGKPHIAQAEETSYSSTIFTAAFGKEEYTNSITASRDTNISPKEVYDSIRSSYVTYPLEQMQKNNIDRIPRAWDVSAGAGVSTQTLYNMGYTNIEALSIGVQRHGMKTLMK